MQQRDVEDAPEVNRPWWVSVIVASVCIGLTQGFAVAAAGKEDPFIHALTTAQVVSVICVAIQWIAYIPAVIFRSEKWFDLTGSVRLALRQFLASRFWFSLFTSFPRPHPTTLPYARPRLRTSSARRTRSTAPRFTASPGDLPPEPSTLSSQAWSESGLSVSGPFSSSACWPTAR